MPNKKQEKFNNKGEIVIYKPAKGEVELRVRLEENTIWLDAHQMARIFDIDRSVVVKHVSNIYKTKELEQKSTCAKIAQVASDGKIRKMNLYNLDMIISVGYRVNSQRATQFRIWATKILRKYILQGYAINQKRLLEAKNNFNKLQQTILFLQKQTKKELVGKQANEILNLLADYSKTFSLLEKYDQGKLKKQKGQKAKFVLEYKDCQLIIQKIKNKWLNKKQSFGLFGKERDGALQGIIKGLYQTFDKKELYTSIEIKSANLLYLIIKDHPFSDGNKRIASFLFVYFLDKNNYLYRQTGEKKINDNALTALTLLIAESNPQEKEQMIALVMQLLK
jgi:hypothetical protein